MHSVDDAISRRRREYAACVAKIKRMAGIEGLKPRTLRESIREGAFDELIAEATDSDFLSSWSIAEQITFLDTIASLPPEARSVRVHALAYGFYRNAFTAAASSPQI